MAYPLPADPLAVGPWLDRLEADRQLPPELDACRATPQPPNHHAEGDVYRHSRLAVAQLEGSAARVGVAPTLTMAMSVLCHDIGKPICWNPVEGNFHGHDKVGAEMVPAFLDRVDPQRRVERERVVYCVREHLFWLHADMATVRDAAVARRYCRPDGWGADLRVVNLCDGLASWGPDGRPDEAYLEACQLKVEQVCSRVEEARRRPPPVITGVDVMAVLGIPEGPAVGEWLRRFEATGIGDRAEALAWLSRQHHSPSPG